MSKLELPVLYCTMYMIVSRYYHEIYLTYSEYLNAFLYPNSLSSFLDISFDSLVTWNQNSLVRTLVNSEIEG